jgi:hypothetical protein
MSDKFKELIASIKVEKGGMKVSDYADAEMIHYESSVLFINNQEILKIKDNGLISFKSEDAKSVFVKHIVESGLNDFLMKHNSLDKLSVFDAVHCIANSSPEIAVKGCDIKRKSKPFFNFSMKSEQDLRAEKFMEHTRQLISRNKSDIGFTM